MVEIRIDEHLKRCAGVHRPRWQERNDVLPRHHGWALAQLGRPESLPGRFVSTVEAVFHSDFPVAINDVGLKPCRAQLHRDDTHTGVAIPGTPAHPVDGGWVGSRQ